jgi:hypothetical protein
MDPKAFILGALALLLLFGCVGPGGGAKPSTPQQQPSQQLASGVGDADISVNQPANETDLLPQAEPIEADNSTVAATTAAPAGNSGVSGLEGSVDVSQVNESDVVTDAEQIEYG